MPICPIDWATPNCLMESGRVLPERATRVAAKPPSQVPAILTLSQE